MNNELQYTKATEEQILDAIDGEVVEIKGPKYDYTLMFNPNDDQFTTVFVLGQLDADLDNLQLFRFI